jgi:hypothetical protein
MVWSEELLTTSNDTGVFEPLLLFDGKSISRRVAQMIQ